MKAILILLGCLATLPFAFAANSEDSEHIVVKLATESQLIPMYLSKFTDTNSGFDLSYLRQLEEVLLFDLNHNGMTQVVKHNQERDRISAKFSFDQCDDLNAWKAAQVFYVIKARISDKKLAIRMLAVNNLEVKKADEIPLTGNFNQDRRQMHRVADMIHKTLFQTEGIAATHIIYTVTKKDAGGKSIADVWEADYDGENARPLTQENALCVNPAYIPPKPGQTANRFFYVCYRSGQPKIYIGNVKGGKGQRFTYLKGNQFMPAISKQREGVAFICDISGNPDLFFQPFNIDVGAIGKARQIFATFKATQGTPSFSPDGKQIAFVSNKDGSPRIYIIDIPSPGVKLSEIKAKLITKHGQESTAPAWSPDGTKLAYCSMTRGVRQIWIYDFAAKEERQLTQGSGHKENPTWAPNSLHLVFNSATTKGSELYLINLNQPEAEKISTGSGDKRFPSWEPR